MKLGELLKENTLNQKLLELEKVDDLYDSIINRISVKIENQKIGEPITVEECDHNLFPKYRRLLLRKVRRWAKTQGLYVKDLSEIYCCTSDFKVEIRVRKWYHVI